MGQFEAELVKRSPMAAAVLDVCDHVFDPQLLDAVYDEHRGRCYQDTLTFDGFLRLMRDALLVHGGSGHKLFLDLERRDANPVDESSFYRKLAHTPVAVSRALLSAGTRRLSALMPADAVTLPACFDAFAVLVGDGKKVKNAAKRLAPTRGFTGRLIGAKALVAMDARTGLAVAMTDSLDGMANDVPLVPDLMRQLVALHPTRPMLGVWDRQFDDARTLGHLAGRAGDAYVVRVKQGHAFAVESVARGVDGLGRAVRVRRVTLARPGAEAVVVLTNLLDRDRYPAADLLALYRHRWGIEQVFQQVTETFGLAKLIGSAPKAVLLQFGYCLLLYNVMRVVQAFVADDGGVLMAAVSTYYLFDRARKELEAWAYHTDGGWPRVARDAAGMTARLRRLLAGSWDPITLAKAADRKPRAKPKPTHRLHGGHSSVYRVCNGTAKAVAL